MVDPTQPAGALAVGMALAEGQAWPARLPAAIRVGPARLAAWPEAHQIGRVPLIRY